MKQMGYNSCLADPNLWMRSNTRKRDGLKYYEYALFYVDNVLAVEDDLEEFLKRVDKYLGLKPGLLADPNIYLDARVKFMAFLNGVIALSLIPSKYVQEAVKNVETCVKYKLEGRWKIPNTEVNPFPIGYEPTKDVTPELDPELALYYQLIIVVLRWMVELGRTV